MYMLYINKYIVVDEDYQPSGTYLEESFSEIESPENDAEVIQPLTMNDDKPFSTWVPKSIFHQVIQKDTSFKGGRPTDNLGVL